MCVTFVVWKRRADPVLFKVILTVVAFVPVLGPLFAMWTVSFPDRMHPALQAKYPKMVNSYSFPTAAVPEKKAARRRSIRRKGSRAT